MIKSLNNKIIFTIIIISSALGTLFAFNNMTPSHPVISQLVNESRSVQLKINDTSLSTEARQFYLAHKKLVLNVLASKIFASDCDDLLAYDDTMITGKYVFYPNGDIKKPALFQCNISKKQVTNQSLVKNIVTPSTVASFPIQNFYKTVTLRNSTVGGVNKSQVSGIKGMPSIINKLATSVCKPNVDYGFDSEGIWVKNGCSATFKVPIEMPLNDRYIASTSSNPNPILGYFAIEPTEDSIIVKGWSCEKGKKEQVNVQVYAGGQAGVGTLVATGFASNKSEVGVSEACNTTGVGHRFLITIPKTALTRFNGKPLFVHGLSSAATGTNNGDLTDHGQEKFPGANHCGSNKCSFENSADNQGINRFLIRNDQASITRRCQELGYTFGEALSFYTHDEWCRYGNARTKYWDGSKWVFTSCIEGNVKSARCQ